MRYVKIALCVLGAALAATAVTFAVCWYNDNRKTGFAEDYVLYVYPDMPSSAVLDSLECGAGARNMRSLERTFRKMEVEEKIKPGRYVIDTDCDLIRNYPHQGEACPEDCCADDGGFCCSGFCFE